MVNKTGRDWHLMINPALWAYRMSNRTPTGTTPYALVYGSEVFFPIEVEIPSLRIRMHGLVTDDDYRVSRLQELELLDEHRQAGYDHLRVYQKRMSRGYNKKVRHTEF